MGPRRRRNAAAANPAISASADQQSAPTKTRGKDDYPVIILTNTNFPNWILGVKTAARKYKAGGEDLLHIIDHAAAANSPTLDEFFALLNNCCVEENHKRGNFINPNLNMKSTTQVKAAANSMQVKAAANSISAPPPAPKFQKGKQESAAGKPAGQRKLCKN